MARSPQVILRERDQSSFPATSSDTILAIIGFATKGPIGKAIELSGRNAFESTFGSIPKNAPWGHMAAYKAFRQGRVIYYRVANDDAAGAEIVVNNAHPESSGYQEFVRSEVINYGEYLLNTDYEFSLGITDPDIVIADLNITDTSDEITVADTTGLFIGMEVVGSGTGIPASTTIAAIEGTTVTLSAPATATGVETVTFSVPSDPITITVTSPNTGDWELNALAKSINTFLQSLRMTVRSELVAGKIRLTSDITGVESTVSINAVLAGTDENLVTLLGGVETAVDGAPEVLASATDNILFQAREKGTDTEKIAVSRSRRWDQVEERWIETISVWFDGEEVETFEDVSMDITEDDFFAKLMNREPENDGSKLVRVIWEDTDDDGEIDFPVGTYQLGQKVLETDVAWTEGADLSDYNYRKGNDGAPVSGGAGLFATAMNANSDLANSEMFNYHILLTPDNGSQTTQNAAIGLAESRGDFFYVADPPFGLSYTDVVDWHNGSGGHGRDAALNTSFAATYWPWLKDMNPRDNEYLWCPPSVFLGEKLMQVDRNYAPWYAPAGDLRGRLVANDTEYSPNLNQRDFIYGRPNCVNPIVNFSTKGIVIYGQKTTLRARSALDRVNVRRMAIYASKLIKESMEGLIFEPHLPDSWARATDFINRILEPIRRDNGLEDYQVIIDGTTNDADAIANNVMKGIVRLVPVNAIETIDLTISFLSPGVAIS